jgi:hypothetical protein
MSSRRGAFSRLDDERGAVLIQVAVAMLALLALSAFVFDYGVMWVSRGQAQNSADAGALSGAISLAFNSPTDQAAARARAIAMAKANQVWKAEPSVLDADVTFPACPPGIPGPQDNCVKVDVFRNQARGNPLPTFFGRLAGVMDQGTVATATAQVVSGDSTACLRPWAVVDRWQEFGPEGPALLPTSTFDKYSSISLRLKAEARATRSPRTEDVSSRSRWDPRAETRFRQAGSERSIFRAPTRHSWETTRFRTTS